MAAGSSREAVSSEDLVVSLPGDATAGWLLSGTPNPCTTTLGRSIGVGGGLPALLLAPLAAVVAMLAKGVVPLLKEKPRCCCWGCPLLSEARR